MTRRRSDFGMVVAVLIGIGASIVVAAVIKLADLLS